MKTTVLRLRIRWFFYKGGVDLNRRIDVTMIVLAAILLLFIWQDGIFNNPMEWLIEKLLMIPGIVIGLAFHEYAHAVVAYKMGDPTPKLQGRLTINPIVHFDWWGLLCLFFIGFGWGKPVMTDPSQYKNRKSGELLVSLAGVAMNLIIAVVFAVIARILLMTLGMQFLSGAAGSTLWMMINYIISINLVLLVFNLIPCPPLDGFNAVMELFNLKSTEFYWTLRRFDWWILLALVFLHVIDKILYPSVNFLYGLLQNYIIF